MIWSHADVDVHWFASCSPLHGNGDEVDASTDGYTYNFPSGSDMFPAGTTFYLIAEDCETPDPPTGSITQLTADSKDGRRHQHYIQLRRFVEQ